MKQKRKKTKNNQKKIPSSYKSEINVFSFEEPLL